MNLKACSRWIALAACGLLASTTARAEIAVSAQFSQDVVSVGESVQFHVKVSGSRSAGQPPTVANVEGLRIGYVGPSQSTNVQIVNGAMKSETNVTYVYQVEPTRAGEFTIPAVRVAVDGRTFETQPVVLKAEDGATRGARGPAASATLEVILPKNTAYVGETVPVEIRMSMDSRVRWDVETMPEIPGEGFIKQKLPQPRRAQETRNGREMDVVVFRTAITPSKAGTITLGPIEVPYLAQVPRAQKRNRPRSFFDMFDDDSVFGDPFFSANQRFRARAEAVQLEVKPLPSAGRPKNFSGAVGEFTLSATGGPSRVKVGDPVTMRLSVSGRGNFDRMEAPTLADAAGWRSYPASGDFKADDDLGVSGTKTFSIAVIPETLKTTMPVFEFAYFDPEAEKYVTLTSEAEKLIVDGNAAAPATPPPTETRHAEQAPPAAARDILGIRYDAGGGRKTFEPLYRQRAFLLAQIVPLAGLLALIFLQYRKSHIEEHRRSEWARERAAALARLRGGEMDDSRFLNLAVEVVQKEVALSSNRLPGSVDAAAACASRALDEETRNGIEKLFNAHAEALYAGAGGPVGTLSAEQRRAVLATLEAFERSAHV
jgi:hypothetical protein